jgi:hypothetical protein
MSEEGAPAAKQSNAMSDVDKKKALEVAAKTRTAGRRRAVLASTEVTLDTLNKARCESAHELVRFQT